MNGNINCLNHCTASLELFREYRVVSSHVACLQTEGGNKDHEKANSHGEIVQTPHRTE